MKNTKKKSPKGKMIGKEYVVESIRGKRFYQNETQYYVKWKGFGPEHCTWEPMQNLGKCIHLLAKFENYIQKAEYSIVPPAEPEPNQLNNWNIKSVRLSESSDEEPSPALERVTPSKSRRALSTATSSSSSSSSSSESSSTSSQSSSSPSQPQPQPEPEPVFPTKQTKGRPGRSIKKSQPKPQAVLPTKQTKTPLQPDLSTNKEKVKVADTLDAAKKNKKGAVDTKDWSSLDDEDDYDDGPTGLELGLKFEKVFHHFAVENEMYLAVKWVDSDEPDMVHISQINQLYPNEIKQYFEILQRLKNDLVSSVPVCLRVWM
uniref:Rhino n=1 Tax=Drosophila affinis TaxID=7246 RepID=Q49BI8_DROAI|nr:rhino [Drosophila affinis]